MNFKNIFLLRVSL